MSSMMGWGWGWMGIMGWLVMLAPIVLLIWFLFSRTKDTNGSEDPLEILKVRYAKGEITREEYERMKETLRP